MNRVRDLTPARDMRVDVDARRCQVALTIVRGLCAFADQKAEAGALGIMFWREIAWRAVWLCAAARHRRHCKLVRKIHAGNSDGGLDIVISCLLNFVLLSKKGLELTLASSSRVRWSVDGSAAL